MQMLGRAQYLPPSVLLCNFTYQYNISLQGRIDSLAQAVSLQSGLGLKMPSCS